jgi:hypothetical protein
MKRARAVLLLTVVATSSRASADEPTKPEVAKATPASEPAQDDVPAKRHANATFAQIFHGPFRSSRLFAMPTADVIGAYMLSIGGDGSLLQETGVLTSAGVLAIGFGDIAQLEYRHTAAISVTGVNAPLPAIGVQFKAPIPEHSGVPAIGVALRLGRNRTEPFDVRDANGNIVMTTTIEEKVTDFYGVARLHFDSIPLLTLHGGIRMSPATMTLRNDPTQPNVTLKRTLYLPTSGVEVQMNPDAKLVAEFGAVPQFKWAPNTGGGPSIGYGVLGRAGLRWKLLPSVIFDGSIGYQLEVGNNPVPAQAFGAVVEWDIRLGAELFVPWGALACRAVGVFCD